MVAGMRGIGGAGSWANCTIFTKRRLTFRQRDLLPEERTQRQIMNSSPSRAYSRLPEDAFERIDPRKRRTRVALQRALEELLQRKDFESISVQDIAEAADLNRATFYAHYPDKFALLECMVGRRFNELLQKRDISVEAGCMAALNALTLAVCDYLVLMQQGDGERSHQLEPHIEAAVIGCVRGLVLDGLERHVPRRADVSHEMMATAASWALYGAAKEWAQSKKRARSEVIVNVIRSLVAPILEPPSIPKLKAKTGATSERSSSRTGVGRRRRPSPRLRASLT